MLSTLGRSTTLLGELERGAKDGGLALASLGLGRSGASSDELVAILARGSDESASKRTEELSNPMTARESALRGAERRRRGAHFLAPIPRSPARTLTSVLHESILSATTSMYPSSLSSVLLVIFFFSSPLPILWLSL